MIKNTNTKKIQTHKTLNVKYFPFKKKDNGSARVK